MWKWRGEMFWAMLLEGPIPGVSDLSWESFQEALTSWSIAAARSRITTPSPG